MQRYKFWVLTIICIVLLSGCSAENIVSDIAALPLGDGATEITVEVMDYSSSFYENAAKKFEEETGVKVNVINNYESGQSNEEYPVILERVQAELMAGKGADIYGGINLDFIDIGHNGHLCNLANWIASDPYFSDDTYYMNIFKSGFNQGDVYSVPLFMMFNALGSTIEVPELEGKSLNWEEFFELTKGIKKSGVLYGITDYLLFVQRFRDRHDSFIDEENEAQNLDSPEMVGLMEQCKKWSEENLCIDCNTEDQSSIYESAFFKEYGGDIEMLTNIRFDSPYMEGEPYLYDIPTDSGKNDRANKIFTTDLVCINAASPYKGTAWKFIKFLLREDIQATGFYTPVNREAAEENIRKTLTETIEYSKLDIDPDEAIKETELILDAVDELPDIYPTDIERIIYKEAIRYFRNEISADAAAQNMAAGVTLYFKEQ